MAKSPQPVLVVFGFPLDLLVGVEPEPLSEEELRRISILHRAREREGVWDLQQHIADFRVKHGLELYRFE